MILYNTLYRVAKALCKIKMARNGTEVVLVEGDHLKSKNLIKMHGSNRAVTNSTVRKNRHQVTTLLGQ